MVENFHYNFLSYFLTQPLDIWNTALTCGPMLWDSISGLSLIRFLFTDLVNSKIFDINGQWKEIFITVFQQLLTTPS
jgi:hypothetical protein